MTSKPWTFWQTLVKWYDEIDDDAPLVESAVWFYVVTDYMLDEALDKAMDEFRATLRWTGG